MKDLILNKLHEITAYKECVLSECETLDKSKKLSIFERKDMSPEVKPKTKPKVAPSVAPVREPSRRDKPFLPNVTPGVKTRPKAKM